MARVLLARIGFSPELWLSNGATVAVDAEPCIQADVTFDRRVSCIFWGNTPAKSGIGEVTCANAEGFFDDMLMASIRDTAIELYVGNSDDDLHYMTLVAQAVIDRIEARGEDTVSIILADKAAQLDIPLQPDLYPSGLADSIQGQAKPVCFGTALSVPAPLAAPAQLDFDVHDDDFLNIVRVRDQGLDLTPGTGWIRSPAADRQGFRKLASIAGRIVADVEGAVRPLADVVTESVGDFVNATWVGGEPHGWSAVTAFSGTVTEVSGGARFQGALGIDTDAAALVGPATASGRTYHFTVNVSALAAGEVYISDGSATWASFSVAGVHRGSFTTSSSGAVEVGGGFGVGISFDATVATVRVFEARLIERLPDIIHYLCVTRAGFSDADLDSVSIETLDTDAPYTLGAYYQDGITIRQVMDQVMDSYAGWWWVNRFGQIAVGRLIDPAIETPDWEFEPMDIVEPGVQTTLDRAQGFSSICSGLRNWHVHTEAEIAGSATASLRATLGADYRVRRTAAGIRPSEYGFSVGATIGLTRPELGAQSIAGSKTGIGTLLTDAADVQTEANRWGVLYDAPRRFFDITVAFQDDLAALDIEPGDIVSVTYPRFGLDTGRPLLVVGASGRFLDGEVRLTLWG